MARDPRAAGGAGEGEMGGEAAIREADGSPFFSVGCSEGARSERSMRRESASEVSGRGACCTCYTVVVGAVLVLIV